MSIMHNGEKVLNNLTTVPITQTINASSTETQIPSAKASYDITKYNTIGLECPSDKSPLEFALENTVQNKIVYFTSWGNSTSDKGDSFSTYIAIRHQDDRYVALFCIPAYGKTKINNYQESTWTGWQNVCTTSVSDSSGTVTLPDGVTGTIYYKVINGICYVSVQRLADGLTGLEVVTFAGLPKADVFISISIENSGNCAGTIYSADGVTFHVHKTVAGEGYGSFSYPVAES